MHSHLLGQPGCQPIRAEINASRLEFSSYSRSQERELADYVCFLLEVDKR